MEVANAEATLRSARAFYYETIDAAWQKAQRGEPIPIEERRDMRLATTHAVQASVLVVDSMYTLAGGSSVYDTSDLQRRFRDVHVATQHIMVAPSTLETVGRLLLGVRRIRRRCEREHRSSPRRRAIRDILAPPATEEDLRRWPNDPQLLEN